MTSPAVWQIPDREISTSTLRIEPVVRAPGSQPLPAVNLYAPLRCSCGAAIALACAKACPHPQFERRRPRVFPLTRPPRRSRARAGHHYKRRVCVSCTTEYQPTGPRGVKCERCR